jgi:hypothetical protein
MTARRRRKSGSGPAATALIAWVGGAQTEPSSPASMIDGELSGRAHHGRAILVGRACGLAAGTLLACGSVLAGATHVGGDGPIPGANSVAGDNTPLFNHTPTGPGTGSGASGDAPAPAERMSAAPDLVSAQAVTDASPALHPRLGRVRRNSPVSLDVPAEPGQQSPAALRPWDSPAREAGHTPASPIAPVSPVLDPAAKQVGRVAPVGGVLPPANPREARSGSPRGERRAVVPPLGDATQPAMALLTSLLPIG